MLRMKKDDQITEMILRCLQRQPENRRCINCNSSGPQYVCTTFWTFVCTDCSGVHREFSHRVKSVSMAKFNEDEIAALRAGGNERARKIYFRAWDPQQNSLPDNSNLDGLREFIKHIYIDRRYAGANSPVSLSTIVKTDSSNSYDEQLSRGVRKDLLKRHSFDRHLQDSRDSYNEQSNRGVRKDFLKRHSFDRHLQDSRDSYNEQSSRDVRKDFMRRLSFDRSSSVRDKESVLTIRDKELEIKNIFEERSPRNIQETPKSGSRGRSTIRFEIVDDRFREDGSVKHYDRRASSREPRSGSSSPASVSTPTRRASSTEPRSGSSSAASVLGTPTLPALRPAKDLLGEKAQALKVGESPKASDAKDADGSARGQRTVDGAPPTPPPGAKQEQNKTDNPSSLIDFDSTPEPTQNKSKPQAERTGSNTNNESSSIGPSTVQAVASSPDMNFIESLLLDWPYPVTFSDSTSQTAAGTAAAQPTSSEATDSGTSKAPEVADSPKANIVTENDQQLHKNSEESMGQVNRMHHLFLEQQNQTLESPVRNANPQRGAMSIETLNSQMQELNNSSPNDQRQVQIVPLEQSSQAVGSKDQMTAIGRKELPQDLFTPHFNTFTPALGGWPYGMQFQPPAMPVSAFVNPPRPRNPFDISDDRFQVQPENFPPLSPFQVAPPDMPVPAPFGFQPSPYATAFASLWPQYSMNMPQDPGAYMGQPHNVVPPTRPQGNADFGRPEDAFLSLNLIQPAGGTYSLPAAPNYSAPRGRNPFEY